MAKQIAQVVPRRASSAVVRVLLQQVHAIDEGAAEHIARHHLGRDISRVLVQNWEEALTDDQFAAVYLASIDVIVGFSARREGRPPMVKAEYDLLCHCVITCQTLRQVIERTRAFLLMIGSRGAVVSLKLEGSTAEFQLSTEHSVRDRIALLGDLTGLASLYRLFAWLVDLPFELMEVRMCYPKLISDEVSAFLLPCPITYNAEVSALRFSANLLDRPVIRGPQQLAKLLARFPFDVDDTRGPHVLLGERVRAVMLSRLSSDRAVPTETQMADLLGISSSTLKRRLKAEHTTYRGIKDGLLRSLAVDKLEKGNRSVEALAVDLGFSDAACFRQAFKRWTGASPSRYLRSRLAQ